MPTWVLFILENVVLAIFTGIVTSFLFLAVLFRFRPKIEISSKIARGTSTNTEETIYRIKVINRTKYPITDIRAQLHVYKNYQTATGEICKSRSLTLKRSDPIIIEEYDRDDSDANYAYRFVTYDNLEDDWKDDKVEFLRFRIFARHSLSGFGGFFKKDYRTKKRCIVSGDFEKGDSFAIE